MPVIGDVLGLHNHLEMRLLLTEGFQCVLRIPLKRRLRLGNEARSRSRDTNAARTIGGILAPAVGDLFADVRNTVQILIGFRRQTHHEIELDIVPSALKCDFAGMQNIFFADVLIDNVAQTLCARLAGRYGAARSNRACTLSGRTVRRNRL